MVVVQFPPVPVPEPVGAAPSLKVAVIVASPYATGVIPPLCVLIVATLVLLLDQST